jgi:hypothetical protein
MFLAARRVHRRYAVCIVANWAFLLLVAATGVQTRPDSRLQQAEMMGLQNVHQFGLENEVPSQQAGTSGAFIPSFAYQGATKLKPHTVRRPDAQGARAFAPNHEWV